MRHWRTILISTILMLVSAMSAVYAQDSECGENDNCREVAEAHPEYGLSEAEIQAFSPPEYETLTVSTDLLHDRRYMRAAETNVSIYDSPGRNVIRTLDTGFNFVTALGEQNGWVQINPGEWVRATELSDTNYIVSHFTGVFLPDEPLEFPVAWMLVNAYPSSEPGGEPLESNGLLYRYTRIHIFDRVEIDGWLWYQISPDKWVHQTNVGKVISIERPETVDTEKWVSIDLYEQVLTVYEGEKPIFATLVSTGLPRWPTYEGTFHIYYRRTRENMSWGTPGDDFYYLEEVPWTMYFDEGRALHGAYWHNGLGYRRSHGCVNMSITDAYWLYNWVAEDFGGKLNSPDVEEGPAVYIYSSGVYR